MIRDRLKKAAREPLLQFLAAGLILFAVMGWQEEDVDPSSRTITVTERKVEELAEIWTRTWQRPPNGAELDELIRDYIKEEIYYREAKRLGLDIGDIVVRRRLRAKMEFLAAAEVETRKPADDELRAWMERHPERFATEPALSFEQVYLGQQVDPNRVRSHLVAGGDPQSMAEASALPRSMAEADRTAIVRRFGSRFADAIGKAPEGAWTGPVPSGYGWHLVRVTARSAARPPRFEEVRREVENDWRAETVRQREADAYQALLDGYTIKIEEPL